MVPPFLRAYPPTQPAPGLALWFPFQHGKLIVQEKGKDISLIERDSADMTQFHPQSLLYLGTLEDKPCLACELDDEEILPENWRGVDLRTLYGMLDELPYELAGYAHHLLNWQRHHRYCSNCGHLADSLPASWGKQCPHCGYIYYPTVTPAILVLIHDGDKVLLAGKSDWNKRRSILAGFVEPGETLEDCVRREIYEEVGLQVEDITYAGNQPWPYPDQLMIGFTARYVSGEIRLQQEELSAADWYKYDDLPELPGRLSLSYQIIKRWADSRAALHARSSS